MFFLITVEYCHILLYIITRDRQNSLRTVKKKYKEIKFRNFLDTGV